MRVNRKLWLLGLSEGWLTGDGTDSDAIYVQSSDVRRNDSRRVGTVVAEDPFDIAKRFSPLGMFREAQRAQNMGSRTTLEPISCICLVRLEGFEPPTPGSEDQCSNPLSYRRRRGIGVRKGIRTLDLQGHNLAP